MDKTRVPAILPFRGGGECPVQYYCAYAGWNYYVRYRSGHFSATRYQGARNKDDLRIEQKIGDKLAGHWNDGETTVYLALVSEAIQNGRLAGLIVPTTDEAKLHEWYLPGPLPNHIVGLGCGVQTVASGLVDWKEKYQHYLKTASVGHLHDQFCYIWVPAWDVEDWVRKNQREHELLVNEVPHVWFNTKSNLV